jgi:Domain of unknown function (DUF4169)
MGKIINLRKARKQRERAAKEEQAAQNRVTHGRTKTEKKLTDAKAEKAAGDLEAHKRDLKD